MWKLGNLEINSRVVLAPMAGYTSSSYREYLVSFGAGVCVSEMVSDMGLIFNNKETINYLRFNRTCCPTGVQLFGHDPENIKKAVNIAKKMNNCIDFIDFNMGCPVPKVTKTGAGSALMNDPKLCGQIIRAIKEETNLPVSAKIRLGCDDKTINFLEVIQELENAGVDMIAIHARTKKDLYSGEPRFELLKNLRSQMNVPLVVSGNIYSLDDAIKAMDITGADAVMVARGGVGNPYLVKQIDHYFKTGERLPNPSFKEQVTYCLELAKALIEEKGEDVAMRIYRSIAPKFFSGFANSKSLRVALATKLVNYDSLTKIMNEFIEENNLFD